MLFKCGFSLVLDAVCVLLLIAVCAVDFLRLRKLKKEKQVTVRRSFPDAAGLPPDSRPSPFGLMRRTDPIRLLNVLRDEHPQVIALALSFLEPCRASIVLENLPEELQGDVAYRIANMGAVSPEVIGRIEAALEEKLSDGARDHATAGGIESLVEILNFAGKSVEKRVTGSIKEHDPEFAGEIEKRTFIFYDIAALEDRFVHEIIQEVNPYHLATALKGADAEVQRKIFGNMLRREANVIRRNMKLMGPVRLKAVEESRQKIVSIIRRLEDEGKIVIAPGELVD